MEALVQCPVCTLYLHHGMALHDHLDTHPKDQVIRALCSLARPPSASASASSRPSTPSRASSRSSRRSRRPPPSPAEPPSDDDSAPVAARPDLYFRPQPYDHEHFRPFHHDKPERSHYVRQIPSLPLNFAIPNAFGGNQKNIIIAGPLPVTDANGNKSSAPMICNSIPTADSKSFAPVQTAMGGPRQIIYNKILNDPQNVNFSPILPSAPNVVDDPAPQPLTAFQNVMLFKRYPEQPVFPAVSKFENPSYVGQVRNVTSYQSNYAEFLNSAPILINETSVSQSSSARKFVSVQNLPGADVHPDVSLLEIPKFGPSRPVDGPTPPEGGGKLRGLRILSNVKIEPIQNSYPSEPVDYASLSDRGKTEEDVPEPDLDGDEAILPDLDEGDAACDSYSRGEFSDGNCSTTNSIVDENRPSDAFPETDYRPPNTFSVIKNVGNPNPFKDVPSGPRFLKPEGVALPDLTCEEKPFSAQPISLCGDSTEDSAETAIETGNAFSEDRPKGKRAAPETISRAASKNSTAAKKTKAAQKCLKLEASPAEKIPETSSSVAGDDLGETYSSADEKNDSTASFSYCPDGFFKEIDESDPSGGANSLRSDSQNFTTKTESVDDGLNPFEDDRLEIVEHPLNSLDDNDVDVKDLQPYRLNYSEKNGQYTQQTIEFVPDQYDDPKSVHPVNVIAFGSINLTNGGAVNAERSPSMFNLPDKPASPPNLPEEATVKVSNDSLYAEMSGQSSNFTVAKDSFRGGDMMEGVMHKEEVIAFEDEKNKDLRYDWFPQKDEFAFTNFIQCNYSQTLYQKISDCIDEKELANVVTRKDYTELVCPGDGYLEPDRKKSFLDNLDVPKISLDETEALNIRTDERMPPRGELSEQESSGDTDAPWAGMYHDNAGSTSYDLLAKESWPSDGSDADMPASPLKHTFNENDNEVEDIPIVVSIKPPDRNYKCAACGKGFNCPKERRVHRTTEHPSTPTNTILERKLKRKQILTKTNIKIKKEKIIKTESVISTTQVSLLQLENQLDVQETFIQPNQLDIKPIKSDSSVLNLSGTSNQPLVGEKYIHFVYRKKRNIFTCDTCKEDFPTDTLYQEHMKIHPLECLTCGKLFHKRANLRLHIKRHLGIKNHGCDICQKRFITKQKLVEHYNIHTGISPIKCNLCHLTFRRYSNMTQHRNRHHFQIKKSVRDYVCVCGEVFHSKKKLAWHKEIHDDKPKSCLYCNEKFVHTASLTRHMRRTHNNYFVSDESKKSLNVQCTECNLVYLKSSIEMHMKTHTGAKPYSCVICNKNFTTKWNLKLHKWTHANRSAKPFKCSLCKGAFMRQTDYISHMNSHKAVRPYTCNHCGCQFIRKYNCQRHVKEHETEKKFVCEVPDCGKSFHRSYYLTEHLKVHSGVRPYSCNICGKTSSTKSNHNKHIKIHHAREPVTTEG